MLFASLKLHQRIIVNLGLRLGNWNITKTHNHTIGRMIMALMKFNQLIMSQIRNIGRVTARIIMISGGWE